MFAAGEGSDLEPVQGTTRRHPGNLYERHSSTSRRHGECHYCRGQGASGIAAATPLNADSGLGAGAFRDGNGKNGVAGSQDRAGLSTSGPMAFLLIGSL